MKGRHRVVIVGGLVAAKALRRVSVDVTVADLQALNMRDQRIELLLPIAEKWAYGILGPPGPPPGR